MKTLKVPVFMTLVILSGSMAHAREGYQVRCTGIETITGQKSSPFLRVDRSTLYMTDGDEPLFVSTNGNGVYTGVNQAGSILTKVEFLSKTEVAVSKLSGRDHSVLRKSTYTDLECE
ncbi:MAG: hypothetical protein ACXWRE_09660 [Pseudobdellovibrionaceae bacterium]